MRPGEPKAGVMPYLVARVGWNLRALLDAAVAAAGCFKLGSGGVSWVSSALDFIDVEMR